jgi:hypothetical protein
VTDISDMMVKIMLAVKAPLKAYVVRGVLEWWSTGVMR